MTTETKVKTEMAAKLTAARLAILRRAHYHRGINSGQTPVTSLGFVGGYEAVTEKRNAKWLEENGFLIPSGFGDWYLTEKAVEAVVDAGCAEQLERAKENPRG